MEINERVRLTSTGELGIVSALQPGGLVEVLLASGEATVHVDDLEVVAGSPADVLVAGKLGDGTAYGLRLQAAYLQHAYKYDPLSGLSNARVEPKLHQVFVAHRVAEKLRPRMILADEVGLGKTIEAGLILKEMRARELVNRVLVLCPASLQFQWQYELQSKFNEEFEIIDGDAARFLGRQGDNPWAKRDNVITSLTLGARPDRAQQIVEAGWDLVIFDEAHRVRRRFESANRYRTTQAYDLADELKEIVHGLLLLSATPMQLHPFELYSLIELVEPGLYPSYEAYDRRREELPELNNLMKVLLEWPALSEEDRRVQAEYHYFRLGELGVSLDDPVGDLADDGIRETVIETLVEKRPLTQALVRNRKVHVGGFQERKPLRHMVQLTPEELDLYWDVTEYIRDGYNRAVTANNNAVGFLMVLYQKLLTSSSHALRESFKKRIAKLHAALDLADEEATGRSVAEGRLDEMRDAEDVSVAAEELEQIAIDREEAEWEIAQLEGLVARLGRIRDSKADVLVNVIVVPILERDPTEKILIFTGFIKTQEFLQRALQLAGYRVAVFNGQLRAEEKEKAVRTFKEDAQIMITTEAGGEGRNFQFAHIMVNYDLPWNPMKVEQRIGRLDRIGQHRPVLIYNLANEDTLEERILDILENRIELFTKSVGSLDPILGDIERDLERIVLEQLEHLDESMEDFGRDLETQVEQARLKEHVMGDFILDHASFRRDEANALLERTPLARHGDLRQVLSDALAYYGGSVSEHPDGGSSVALSPRLAARLSAAEAVARGVFDPAEALEREELDFLAFGHPTIDKLVSYARNQDATTGARYLSDAPSGISVEVYYAFESQGVRPSGRLVRHLIGPDLAVQSSEVDALPTLGKEAAAEVPSWAPSAIEASRAVAGEQQHELRTMVQDEDALNKAEEEARERRVHEYRRQRLQLMIERDQAWIDEKEVSGSDRDKRILPARKGQLRKRVEQLQRLDHDLDIKLERLAERRADVRRTIVAAGLVVGE